jgi:hypothetical protein
VIAGAVVVKNTSIVLVNNFACDDDLVFEDNSAGDDDDACVFSASEGSVFDKSVASLVDKGDNSDNDQPDGSVLKLYKELSLLRANSINLDMYSRKEKVSIGLLEILQDTNTPLNAVSQILSWAAKSHESF